MVLRRILILYDGSEAADGLLSMACETVWPAGSVMPLYVTRVPAVLPLSPLPRWYDEEGWQALDRAESVAWRYGCNVDTWLVRSREPADAVVSVAYDGEADAIFLPLCGWRHPFRRLHDGSQARSVAREAPCPVLVGSWNEPGRAWHVGQAGASRYHPVATLDGGEPPAHALYCRLLRPQHGGMRRLQHSRISF